jgi:hypothetical protein
MDNNVKCIDDSCWVGSFQGFSRKLDLTIGKTYTKQDEGRYYRLTGDNCQSLLYPKHCFRNFEGKVLLS